MGVVVSVLLSNEVVAGHSTLTGHSSSRRTDEGITSKHRVGRHELGADELAAVELVCDHDLEGVVKGIDPSDPAEKRIQVSMEFQKLYWITLFGHIPGEPRVHVADRQHESSIDDNC